MMRVLPLVLIPAVMAAGCVEELDPASLVKDTRPLATRVEVDGDPEVARPAPGQAVHIEFLMASPGEPLPVSWALVLCPGLTTSTGQALCGGDPFAFSLQEEPVYEPPVIDFTVPEGFGSEQVVALGVICAGAAPRFDSMMDIGCEEGGQETLLRFTVDVLGPESQPNDNPGLPDVITFAGADWEPTTEEVPLEGCAGSGVPTVFVDGDDVAIDFGIDGFVRDRFVRFDGEEVAEEIVIYHFATGGDFERLISLVDDLDPDAEVDWTPPTAGERTVATGGQRIRFWFVFRDQRGGVSWTTRDACLMP